MHTPQRSGPVLAPCFHCSLRVLWPFTHCLFSFAAAFCQGHVARALLSDGSDSSDAAHRHDRALYGDLSQRHSSGGIRFRWKTGKSFACVGWLQVRPATSLASARKGRIAIAIGPGRFCVLDAASKEHILHGLPFAIPSAVLRAAASRQGPQVAQCGHQHAFSPIEAHLKHGNSGHRLIWALSTRNNGPAGAAPPGVATASSGTIRAVVSTGITAAQC